MTADVQQLLDERDITVLLNTYARAVDTRDWDLWRSLFTDDARIDYSTAPFGMAGVRDEVADWLADGLSAVPMSMHYITNVIIEFDGPDAARVEAMFYNPMQFPGVEGVTRFGGYYKHRMVRTETGWRSAELVEHNTWSQNNPF